MKLGVVVLNYKDYKTTIAAVECQRAIKEIDYIVIVDNASNNESAINLSKLSNDKITFIESDENRGYSAGNNIGIKYLIEERQCDIIGIVNPDVILTDEFVKQIIEDFSHTDYAMITGLQQKPNGAISERFCWPKITRWNIIFLNERVLNRIFNNNDKYIEKKLLEKQDIVSVDTVEGCCFFIRSDDLKNINYLDEDIFLFHEEDILAYKLACRGRKIGIDKRVSFLHNHSTVIKSIYSAIEMDKIALKSREIIFKKYFTESLIDYILFCFSCYVSVWERPIRRIWFKLHDCLKIKKND